jgi:hypothetical protein
LLMSTVQTYAIYYPPTIGWSIIWLRI